MGNKLQRTINPSTSSGQGKAKARKGRGKKVAVGLSGGVDSSVSAALLIEQGYDVTGVFLTCWDENRPGCRIDQDRKDALDIALQLQIPFVSLDFKKEYQEKVIDYFYREYQAGRTPNPDTMCNREIKFGMFYQWALRQENFDFIATGHYARIANSRWKIASSKQELSAISHKPFALQRGADEKKDPHFAKASRGKQSYFLQRGSDEKKDQSYFLYQLRSEQLQHILFPIGHMTKDQVRVEAKKRGLKTAAKPDSQGICFIGEIDVKDFLRERIEEKPGKVVMRVANSTQDRSATHHKPYTDTIIGSHSGTPFYTIGQKIGQELDQAKIAKLAKKGVLDFDTTHMPPLFVIDKDIETNTLIVGEESQTYKQEFEVQEINWLINPFENSNFTGSVCVRIRHGGGLVGAMLDPSTSLLSAQDDIVKVNTTKPIKGVAPGQACVFYTDSSADALVLGGGIIK